MPNKSEVPPTLRLYTYTYWNPASSQYTTLDCCAASREAAMASAVRYLNRINERYQRLEIPWRVPMPSQAHDMKLERPRKPTADQTPAGSVVTDEVSEEV